MWNIGCLESEDHKIHMEERAWRIIDRARSMNINYTEYEIKIEILEIMNNYSILEDLGPDCETSLPKVKARGYLSKGSIPIYMVIIENKELKIRMIKTVWSDFEENFAG